MPTPRMSNQRTRAKRERDVNHSAMNGCSASRVRRQCREGPRRSPDRRCRSRRYGRTASGRAPPLLEIAAQRLLALDRLEERLEVPDAEAARAVALDDLEEERRAILDDLREELQQVALLVAVGED